MGPNEQQLADQGLSITEHDLDVQPDPEVVGILAVKPLDDGSSEWWIHVRTGTSAELRESFAEWALQRIERYLTMTDYDDVWQKTSTGFQQSWARLRYMPEV